MVDIDLLKYQYYDNPNAKTTYIPLISLEEKMKKHFPVIIEQDQDGVFIVECPLFKGCRSYGHSVEEAVDNIKEAIAACIEDTPFDASHVFIGVRDIEMAIA